MTAPVLAAGAWPTNADLIADVARLGYLRKDWRTFDPTYGRGVWWEKWRLDELVIYLRDIDGSDFRDLPEPADSFDAVAYDPPYVCVGGRKTSTLPDFQNRYGLDDAPRTPAGVQALIEEGLDLVDRFEHVTKIRPQPPGRRQVHARRNLSTLFILRKAR